MHHRAAKARIIRHARHRFVGAFQHPVLDGFQILRRAVGAFDDVAIDQPAGAEQRRERGLHAGGIGHLAEPLKHHLPGEVIIRVLLKGQDDVGEFVKRDGARHLQVGRAVHFHFGGQRDQALHFFGGMARPLGK